MAIERIEVEGLEGLLTTVLGIARKQPQHSFLWFRGATSTSYALQPRLLRDGKSMEDVFNREARLLTRFRQRSIAYWPDGYPQTDWEHLFAMQHFGIPTRLLDWSENLFVATHFALGEAGRPNENTTFTPVIWCVDPTAWNRNMPYLSDRGEEVHVLTTSDEAAENYRPDTRRNRYKSPVALFGTHNSNRIVAQRGTFMVWGMDNRPMEAFAEEGKAHLWKLDIKGDYNKLSLDLASLGFGETMIYPELGSLAKELARVEGWR